MSTNAASRSDAPVAPAASGLKVACTEGGCVIRVEGKGTMKESYAAQELARRTLRGSETASVVIDLSDCTYLDSTFLGLLMGLFREFGKSEPGSRYFVAGPAERRARLLGGLKLDKWLPTVDSPPEPRSAWVEVDPATFERDEKEQARHIMECHRRLAELGGPTAAAFTRIAEQIEKELSASSQ